MKKGQSRSIRAYGYETEREALLARMRKIEGQARGITGMLEANRYCIDIVQQLTALSSAANEVALRILQDHIKGCVTEAIKEQRGEEAVDELMGIIRKAIKR